MYRIPYDGGRVSQWAATLDALARELDVVNSDKDRQDGK
jgi:hypothetical protein